jgi:predicted acylesterase/phospholipase RssA
MRSIGLALSGGGFRASLYHLGLVRFLRDAGILSQVSQITSVSGGSVLAAHLVLNWGRFNGSASEFDAAASEFISFVRLDVRNRVIRRYPLALPVRCLRRLAGRPARKLSLTGLLEYHYEKYLYGDTSLFELPEKPHLHVLATNLSEGCLCSFSRDGLLMVRRHTGRTICVDRVHTGLATVAMAVTASSAYPGFFPPLELTGTDVGANAGEFGRQAYTDGGVFDNLGVRMFRCLERPLLSDAPLTREDFVDFPAAVEVLRQAGRSSEGTPLHRLGQLLATGRGRSKPLPFANGSQPGGAAPPSQLAGGGDGQEQLLAGLWDLLSRKRLQQEPLFAGLKPADPDAEALLHASPPAGRDLDRGEQVWLNRHLVEAAYRQATGRPCFRWLHRRLDGVLVSDVGKPFEVKNLRRAGGLVHTAMRATDIVMDRVWQLEIEAFHDACGFVFAPVTDVVEPAEDPSAPHPEVQRQTAHIRTDLDRFSALEISSLVRHGYCVGRKACRARPDLFGTGLPGDPPWDPLPDIRRAGPVALVPMRRVFGASTKRWSQVAGAPASDARMLQAAALRRIWSRLLDYQDWVSYLYVPILVPILVLLPYVATMYYQRSHRVNQIVQSLAQSSRDVEQMSRLLDGPSNDWVGQSPEEVNTLDEPDLSGFEVLQDMRILDLRKWNPAASGSNDPDSLLYGYRRLKVYRKPEAGGSKIFRVRLLPTSPRAQVRFPSQQLAAKVRRSSIQTSDTGRQACSWEASFDFEKVPAGEYVDLIVEKLSPGQFLRRGEGWTTFMFDIDASTAEMTRWLLLPKGKEYRSFRIVRYKTGKPGTVEPVRIVTEYLAEDSTILAYKLLSVDAGYTYEVTWYYK